MIGAILGDIIGSCHEFTKTKTKDFELLNPKKNFITDDTLMTIAVSKAVLEASNDFEKLEVCAKKQLLDIGRRYPNGYGRLFNQWLKSDDPKPYESYGNGAAMRISACGFAYDTLEDVKQASFRVTKVTHDHFEGLKAAEAIAVAIYHLRKGATKYQLRDYMRKYYSIYFTLDEIRDRYSFKEEARYTVPPAIVAFLESTNFEDAIRNAISLGGDADTLAAITGSLAEAYYGVPKELIEKVESYVIEKELIQIIHQFTAKYSTKISVDNLYDKPLIHRFSYNIG